MKKTKVIVMKQWLGLRHDDQAEKRDKTYKAKRTDKKK